MAKKQKMIMQKLFQKEINRIKQQIYREYKKTGIRINKDLIPKIPSRITQSKLHQIQKLNAKQLAEKSYYVNTETGEIVPYSQAVQEWQEEQTYFEAVDVLSMSDTTINNYLSDVDKYNETFRNKIRAWISSMEDEYGIDAVANMLRQGVSDGIIVTRQIVYSDKEIESYITQMMLYLNLDNNTQADILESFESFEDIE